MISANSGISTCFHLFCFSTMVLSQNRWCVTLAVSLIKAWPSAHRRAELADRLLSAGFARPAVAAWLRARSFSGVSDQVEVIRSWSGFFDASTAQEWYDAGFTAEDAYEWASAGYFTDQANAVQRLLLEACRRGQDIIVALTQESQWRESGMAPDDAIQRLRTLELTARLAADPSQA